MTIERTVNPKTIRQVQVEGEPYQTTVEFWAKGDKNVGGFWRYIPKGVDYITGPEFDRFNGKFYLNRTGHWERIEPNRSERLNYYLSERKKPVDKDEEKRREKNLKETYWLVAENVKRNAI
jgi:hypothetical protein